MALTREFNTIDAEFYQPAEKFFPAHRSLALTYDDVTLATLYSEILPRDTQLDTQLAEGLTLNIPVISADMDTVTAAFRTVPRKEPRPRLDPGSDPGRARTVYRRSVGHDR